MKIQAHVLSVADQGDYLTIMGQAHAAGAAEWRPMCKVELSVPLTEHARKAFYVGRRFDVEVKPRI